MGMAILASVPMAPSVRFRTSDQQVTLFRLPWFIILLLSPLWLTANTLAKEIPIKPTFARDVATKVARGGDVEITLQAIPSFGNQINFRVQKAPLHGTLSELHPAGDHTASVRYHHDGCKAPLDDEFTFQAQAAGQAMSEPSRCSITIIPPPASLVFDPLSVDFGAVMLSEKKQTNVTLINRGGRLAEGRLILPKGFSAPIGERYRLGEGESNVVTIEFDPMEERDYAGQVLTQPMCEQSSLELHGNGIARFDFQKTSSTEWTVRSLCDLPIRIFCTGGEGWILPVETTIPPHDSRRLAFQQSDEGEDSSKNTASNALVHLSDGLSDRVIEMPPLIRFTPVVVQTVTPTALGKIPIGETEQIAFTLINRSEYPKHLLWKAVSPSGGSSDVAESVDLKGGEIREIRYDWKPSLPGEAVLTISVQEGHSTRHELGWKASVLESDKMASTMVPNETPEASGTEAPSENSPQPSLVAPNKVIPIPPVTGAGYEVKRPWMRAPVIILKWEHQGRDPSRFKLEEHSLVLLSPLTFPKDDHGAFQPPQSKTVETPIDTATATRGETQEVLKLRRLPPGWHHLVLSQFTKEGSLEAQSQFQIQMPAKLSQWQRIKIPFGVLVITFLLFYLRKIRGG